jgi:hypothetical protein
LSQNDSTKAKNGSNNARILSGIEDVLILVILSCISKKNCFECILLAHMELEVDSEKFEGTDTMSISSDTSSTMRSSSKKSKRAAFKLASGSYDSGFRKKSKAVDIENRFASKGVAKGKTIL